LGTVSSLSNVREKTEELLKEIININRSGAAVVDLDSIGCTSANGLSKVSFNSNEARRRRTYVVQCDQIEMF
jgi:hypothetical protein